MDKISILASGGLDSSVLIAKLADGAEVYPIYVRCGFKWEDAELAGLRLFRRRAPQPKCEARDHALRPNRGSSTATIGASPARAFPPPTSPMRTLTSPAATFFSFRWRLSGAARTASPASRLDRSEAILFPMQRRILRQLRPRPKHRTGTQHPGRSAAERAPQGRPDQAVQRSTAQLTLTCMAPRVRYTAGNATNASSASRPFVRPAYRPHHLSRIAG